MQCGYFNTTQKDNHSAFLTPTMVGGRCSLLSEICAQSDRTPFDKRRLRQISAYNASTVSVAKKSQNITKYLNLNKVRHNTTTNV